MDELMKQHAIYGQNQRVSDKRELTCSVHFTNPKFKPSDSSSSTEELGSVTRLVSKPEELELDRVFKEPSEPSELLVKSSNRSLFELGHNFEDVRHWPTTEQPSKDRLSSVLRYMVETHEKTTVQIEINKMFFNCHLVVLQVYSKFFMDLEQIPLVVSLPEDRVTQKAFMLIYKWMLSDEPYLERQNILEIFVAASYLRIEALLLHCWKYFDDGNCFNEDTACVLYLETGNHPALDVIRNLMLTRINKFFLTFVASKNFLDLPVKHLIFLLSSSAICVNTEIEILFIIVRWLGHDWDHRKDEVPDLIECIRFELMPLWYLLCARRDETHQLTQLLLKHPKVNGLFDEAIACITSAIYKNNGSNIQAQNGFNQRRWIQDKLCDYHHLIVCPNTREVRYAHFESYLLTLQQQSRDCWAKVEFLNLDDTKKCCIMRPTSLRDNNQLEDKEF